MTSILAVPVILALLVALATFVLRPTLRKMSLRHLARRPTETILIVFGAMLGTAIIASSFLISNTVNSSILDIARTQLGPIDIVVSVPTEDDTDHALNLLDTQELEQVDGVISMTRALVPVSDGSNQQSNADTWIQEMDFAAARAFGGDEPSTGLSDAGPTPSPGEAVINRGLARDLNMVAGDELVIYAYGSQTTLKVTRVLDAKGIAGFGGRSVFVAPGSLESAWRASGSDSNLTPDFAILVSNEGGVFGAEIHSAAVMAKVDDLLGGEVAFTSTPVKANLIDDAEADGSEFLEVFGSIGAFSVIAGILLLINIFVMLGEERKRELGIMRAIGFKRSHLVQGFALEGIVYGILASLLGSASGVGVGWIITQYSKSFVESPNSELRLVYEVQIGSLISAAVIGLFITMVTVWIMSLRISRLNIIAAIKGLGRTKRTKPSIVSMAVSSLAAILGVFLFVSAQNGSEAVPLILGPPIAFFAISSLLRGLISQRLLSSLAGIASITWGATVFGIGSDAMKDPSIMAFVAQGVVLVAGAIALLVSNDSIWRGLIRRIPSGLAIKLGTVYPLANRFRTAMMLAMFSLVIFTLTFMITFMSLFESQIPQLRDEISLGHDLYVTSSQTNPVTESELLAVEGIQQANGISRSYVEWNADWLPSHSREFSTASSFNAELHENSAFKLVERDPNYLSDEQAFQALREDSTKILVPDWFIGPTGAPANGTSVGHSVSAFNPNTGQSQSFTIIGTFDDYLSLGAVVNSQISSDLLADSSVTRLHYVTTDPGINSNELALKLDDKFKNHGVEAKTFESILNEAVDEQRSIMGLLEGYLSMGLIIGVAGLGVILVRSVRERRREIGTLRAIGIKASTVRQMFVVESSFVAVQGVLIGASLGLLSAYQVLANSDAFGEARLDFAVPWVPLSIMLIIPLAAASLAALGPAIQASRIRPAVALRTGD